LFSNIPEQILIIDEDGSSGSELAQQLSVMGIEVKAVDDSAEGIGMLRNGLYSIVIIDSVNNISTIKEINENIPDIVILATSKDEAISASVQAIWAGAIDLIPDKIDQIHLETAIRRAIDRKSLLREAVRLKKRITLLYILAGGCFVFGFLAFYAR
jgi:DNA-binding NtrC family response regulator